MHFSHAVFYSAASADVLRSFKVRAEELPTVYMLSEDEEGLLPYHFCPACRYFIVQCRRLHNMNALYCCTALLHLKLCFSQSNLPIQINYTVKGD
jgi:hypothetical protein